jgi:N-acetylglucosaminyldiphosphoundecaprenol N-acetyl-beta-D-mannosaminyltransferase
VRQRHPHAVRSTVSADRQPAARPSLVGLTGNGRSASRVFDIPIELAQPAEMLRTITAWVGDGTTGIARGGARRVMYVNAHVVNQSRALPELRAALEAADLVYCDGYGVRLAARVLEVPVPHRMTGADWVWGLAALCEAAGHSLYLLGSEPGVARDAAGRLRRWYPELHVAGAHHGYFELGSPHADRVIEDINASGADIVLAGMGTPKQELWVERHAADVRADVLWTVGALLDYMAGRVPRAPRWLADHGLEWIFRLALEPHRMWKRYLLGNPVFLSRVMTERERARNGG